MNVFEITPEFIPTVANFMCSLKSEWWDFEGACEQLSGTNSLIKTVGWYLGENENTPKGWILCRELVGYNALEIECCGFDDHGEFKGEHKLGALFDSAEKYAKAQGYLTLRSSISSIEFNIHDQEIKSITDAIEGLRCDRLDYQWYLKQGFRVIGIYPNAYAKGFHSILLAKDVSN